jgi:hypothetical protein
LTNLVVKDGATAICTIASLDTGTSQSCARSITALSGQHSATATVTASPPSPLNSVTASDPAFYFGASPQLGLVIKTNGQDVTGAPGVYALAGSTLNWTYELVNSGNVALSHLTVVDDNGTPGNPADDRVPAGCADISLGVGGRVTCALSGTAPVGQYANAAVATASPPAPLDAVSASDASYAFGVTLAVSLVKQTNGQDAGSPPGPLVAVGSPVSWTYLVTNQSNVAVDISVVDDNGTPDLSSDDVSFCVYRLAAGANQSCARSGTAQAGQHANFALVTATRPVGWRPLPPQIPAITLASPPGWRSSNIPN